MDSERFATILGFTIALAVLAAAFIYVPLGSSNKPAATTAVPAPLPASQAAPAAVVPAAPRGPVVREVPQ